MPDQLPIPPVELRFMGATDEEFERVGKQIADELIEFTGLQAHETVLDIGCGYGRVAHALWQGGHRGRYAGLDILPRHIEWCDQHLTPATGGRYTFHHLDIRNSRYNPTGTLDPAHASIDVGVEADVILLASVFTHMYPDAVRNYLHQMTGLLRPGGRAMATFFLINDSQRRCENEGWSPYPLQHRLRRYARYWNPDDPLHVMAYKQSWVVKQVKKAGLELQTVHLGRWCGRSAGRVYQDTLILRRP